MLFWCLCTAWWMAYKADQTKVVKFCRNFLLIVTVVGKIVFLQRHHSLEWLLHNVEERVVKVIATVTLTKDNKWFLLLSRYTECQHDWSKVLHLFFSYKQQKMSNDPSPCPSPSKQITFPAFPSSALPLFNIRGFLVAIGKNYGEETWLYTMFIEAD